LRQRAASRGSDRGKPGRAEYSLAAVYAIVSERSAQAVRLQQRIAFVDNNPEHDLSRMQFAEDVAVNRGADMRLFGSVEAAERWLLAGPANALGADPSGS
jgi:hypothetical protein